VTDTGVGIKPEFLPFLFERFRQADGSTTRRHGGLRLGLSIVKQRVDMYRGGVRAKSPGEEPGSTCCVSRPLVVVHEPDEERHVRPRKPADDEMDFAAALLDGDTVLVVDDEHDALGLIDGHTFHVLVSDIGLPDADGDDLIREVRARGFSARDLPVVALTAFARAKDRRRAMLAGFQVHVAEPVDPDELAAIVASLVGRTGKT
jgi:CheY-like chemotaxis protein